MKKVMIYKKEFIVLKNFVDLMSKELNEKSIMLDVKEDFVETFFKGKEVRLNYGPHLRGGFQCKDFDLVFNSLSEDSIELWIIKVKESKRGSGLGTNLMSIVLDVADELGVNVHLTPVDMGGMKKRSRNEVKKQTLRLRNWYSDLEFKSQPFSPAMKYSYQK
jgi:GNAT superfamily N-acetyltransferase